MQRKSKSSGLVFAGIIISVSLFSNEIYAALPKAAQADKYKILISKALKDERHKDALKYVKKLEALKVKIPDSILYFKGESWFYINKWDLSKEALETYINKTGSTGKYYMKALDLLGQLEKDIVLNEKQRRFYGTPLHFAASKGILFQVKNMLDEKTYSVNAKDPVNQTPLHKACFNANYKVAKVLIANGAIIDVKNKFGATPLIIAITAMNVDKYDHLKTVEILIKNGANINPAQGFSPLETAIMYKRVSIISLLKKHGAKTKDELRSGIKN